MARVYETSNTPEQNYEILKQNPYVGRLVVVAKVGEKCVLGVGVTGRSDDSRNRSYREQDGIVYTEVFDKSRPADNPELTSYDALRSDGSFHLASNGDQLNTAIQYRRAGRDFEAAMHARTYEPDDSHTPRITGFVNAEPESEDDPVLGISIIRKVAVSDLAVRPIYTTNNPGEVLGEGVAWGIQTYRENRPKGELLPPFEEEPFKLPAADTAKGMAILIHNALEGENFVGAAAMVVSPTDKEIHLINAHRY